MAITAISIAMSENPWLGSVTIGPNSAVSDIIAPTDMSRPLSPEMITVAWAMDAIVRIEVVIRMLLILLEDRNPLLRIRPSTSKRILPIMAGA